MFSSTNAFSLPTKMWRGVCFFSLSLIFAATLNAGPAMAQSDANLDLQVRGYYGVSNLTSGDTLNVRTAASASAPIVGELAQGTIVFATGHVAQANSAPWFEINTDEGEGLAWVSSNFLDRREVLNFGQTRAPQAGTCSGFEPGWDVAWNQVGINAVTMSGPLGTAQFSSVITPAGTISPSVIEFRNNPEALRFTLVLEDRICTALPTDAAHYQSGLLLVEKNGTLSAYSGCCNPSPEALGN